MINQPTGRFPSVNCDQLSAGSWWAPQLASVGKKHVVEPLCSQIETTCFADAWDKPMNVSSYDSGGSPSPFSVSSYDSGGRPSPFSGEVYLSGWDLRGRSQHVAALQNQWSHQLVTPRSIQQVQPGKHSAWEQPTTCRTGQATWQGHTFGHTCRCNSVGNHFQAHQPVTGDDNNGLWV